MLLELKIKDFAIIDNLSITFTDGMNIFTGETGAGKSIIIGAVNLILGARGSSDFIRSGCSSARVEALFDISEDKEVQEAVAALGFEPSSNLIIKRELSASGKNKITINDSFSTLNALSKLSPILINIYGQNEHQELMNKEHHLEMLDSFAVISPLLEKYKQSFSSLKYVDNKLNELSKLSESKEKEADFVNYQICEINAANLRNGEEEELKREKELLINAEKILEVCSFGFENVYSKADSVCAALNELLLKLQGIKALDNSFESYHNIVKDALYALEDSAFFFRDYPKKLDFSTVSLDDVESRLNVISGLKKKYGGSVENVINKRDELQSRLNELQNATENFEHLQKEREHFLKEALNLATELSFKRHKASENLSKNMSEELGALGMQNAKFSVKFNEAESPSEELSLKETGMDEVEFYFSANPGEESKPLLKVASGGELSRIMLALKSAVAGGNAPSAFIFDEVDAGIGGKTAHIVGAKLKGLSKTNQVICITHLPQIASYADSHYYVAKEQRDGRTVSTVTKLSEKERVTEVARLISGETITEHSLKHAADIIAKNSKEGVSH